MKKVISIILVCIIVTGIGILLYPIISNSVNSYYNLSNIKKYNNNVKSLNNNEINNMLNKAIEYNNAVATSSYNNGIINYGEQYKKVISSYDNILNFENGIIGYIEIPRINVYLPIYHGDLKDVLTKGAAHMKGTSFPIGGKGTHAVISAHSGYPQQKFFDDLDNLKKDDTFRITVLDKKLEYKVKKINIVKPSDTSHTKIKQNKDLVTLVTCYPYGINSHRLLVTGERQYNNDISNKSVIQKNNDIKISYKISFIPIVLFFSYILIFIYRVKRK